MAAFWLSMFLIKYRAQFHGSVNNHMEYFYLHLTQMLFEQGHVLIVLAYWNNHSSLSGMFHYTCLKGRAILTAQWKTKSILTIAGLYAQFLASCFSSMRAYVIPILSVRPSALSGNVKVFGLSFSLWVELFLVCTSPSEIVIYTCQSFFVVFSYVFQ